MQSEQACAPTAESSTLKSVRSCSGEPYHADFFTYDSGSGIPYKRHRTLFNLYNFDRMRASDSSQYATLKLTNCKFNYFLSNYTSLINVETNNFALIPSTGTGVPDYLIEIGDDRGVNINITSTDFTNSQFCKGLLSFKKRYNGTESTTSMTYVSLNNLVPAPTAADSSLIHIYDSLFQNLNYGRIIDTLSLVNNKMYAITGMTTANYPAFDNHGAAINLQGFPGGVEVFNSTFTQNMAFIPDIYPSKLEPNPYYESISNYNNSLTGQISMTRCTE